ncbi:MAG TPA: helix-turn-helix domain-containing protein [Gryllotalpicola sp.]
MSDGATTGHRRADAVRNAGRVQEVALELLATRGSETTIMDIAREAGVGKATVYRNFPTKAALLAFAAEHHGRWLVDRLDAAIADPNAWGGFVELVRDTMARIRTAPILLEALRPHDGPEPAVGDTVNARLQRLVASLHAADAIRPGVTVEDLGMLIIGTSEYLASRSATAADTDRAAELILAAVAAR